MLGKTIDIQNQQLTTFRNIPASGKTDSSSKSSPSERASAGSAVIQFPSDPNKQPTLTSSENLWRWNYTVSKLQPSDGSKPISTSYAIFLVFDKPVDFKLMSVTSSKPGAVPQWSLADSSERTALLFFMGDLADQSITLRTGP
ncbi:hypothetical protein [Bradyrhizobium sp. ARR65]|uniref:hypothetical protein n=1 Tax=Bradyrhizobium sp. ARR65 TaxID=1040989 RepID=UPI0012F9A3B5|nr:hypothetical protein [Bradyrhizobium sp. ARR65]